MTLCSFLYIFNYNMCSCLPNTFIGKIPYVSNTYNLGELEILIFITS